MEELIAQLPKIELHAHLNGSLKVESIRELGFELYGKDSEKFRILCQQFVNFKDTSLDDCFRKFHFMHELTATQKGLRLATLLVIRDFAADNVVYLEIRTTPKSNQNMSMRDYLLCVVQTIEEAQRIYKSISVKLLPSIDRSKGPTTADAILKVTLEMLRAYPHIVVGMDFSGNPICGKFDDYIIILDKARKGGLKVAMHCAEIQNADEIEEMLTFGMDRCGHGTFLSAKQLQHLAERNVPIECCLTSNIKCGTVASYADHHLRELLASGQPAMICTDDCGVFDTSLSREILIAVQTFQLNWKDLRQLSLLAIDHAFTANAEKSRLRTKITDYFVENKFDGNISMTPTTTARLFKDSPAMFSNKDDSIT